MFKYFLLTATAVILAILAASAFNDAYGACDHARTDLDTEHASLIQLEAPISQIWLLYDLNVTTLLAHGVGTTFTFPKQPPGWYILISTPIPPMEGWHICPLDISSPLTIHLGDT